MVMEDDGTGEESLMTCVVSGNTAELIDGLAHFLASPRNGNLVDKAIQIAFENRAKAWAEISRSQSDSQSSGEEEADAEGVSEV